MEALDKTIFPIPFRRFTTSIVFSRDLYQSMNVVAARTLGGRRGNSRQFLTGNLQPAHIFPNNAAMIINHPR
jgi:hypothetical protein